MPTQKDNDAERFARIDALVEEYRLNHEALLTYIQKVRVEAIERHRESQDSLHEARAHFRRTKRH